MVIKGQNRLFYILLLAVLMVHMAFLVVKMRDKFVSAPVPMREAIKLKLIQDAIEASSFKEKKQIVRSEESADNTKVDNAFLSDKNRKFDRQTRAKNTDLFQQAAKGTAAVTTPEAQKTVAAKQKVDFKDLKLSDLGVASGEPLPKKQSQRSPASVKGMENGDPTKQGMSATNDYVEEMALGDFTHLNTVEYKYYGFYHRIRQKLEQYWGKNIRETADTLYRSGRRLPASENLITSVRLTLNSNGEIVKVKIMGTSGVKELDDAAVESFNQAGPFPNPPKDLLVNGFATIEWGFVVKS